MLTYAKENYQFIIISLIWVFVGIVVDVTAMGLVPAAFLIYRQKGYYTEIVLSIALICYLSDNRHWEFSFATKGKDIALLTACAFFFLNSKNFPLRSKIYYAFIPFFILAFFLSTKHPTPLLSFQKTLSFFLMIAVIPNYFLRQLQVEGQDFLRKTIWMGTILYIIAFLMIFVLPSHWTYLEGRYNGLLGNPNGVGTFSTLFFIIVYTSIELYPKIFTRNEKFIIYGSMILSILLASSRNSIFSILIFMMFARFYKISPWIGFVIVIVVALLFQIINENLPYIITSLGLGAYMRVEHLNDGSGRLIAWTFAMEQIQKYYFFLGRGFAFEEWLFEKNKDWLNILGHQGGVHNTYLAVWLNTGIVGLCFYLYGFFSTFIKAARNSHLAFPTMFAIMFSISFEAWFQASLNPFTIMALLAITLIQYKVDEPATQESALPVL
ncbi:MAG: O-antigen ligase family protein [Bacteroidetes bacterium]|nr:O-antigen ligase family protein [Bacteroidota bacterium]